MLHQPSSHLQNIIQIDDVSAQFLDSLLPVHSRRASLLAESRGKDHEVENLRHGFLEGQSLPRTQRSCIHRFDSLDHFRSTI